MKSNKTLIRENAWAVKGFFYVHIRREILRHIYRQQRRT